MSGPGPADGRILSKEDCEKIYQQLVSLADKTGDTVPVLTSWWTGELRWGRNRVMLASDRRDQKVYVRRQWQGSSGFAETNQLDTESLTGVVRAAERNTREQEGSRVGLDRTFRPDGPDQPMPQPKIWSDATYNLTSEARTEVARGLVQEAEAQGLLSAGYLEVRAGSWMQTINGTRCYVPYTQAHCSVTVRDPQGLGSGWAGLSSYDWAKIDAPALAKRALEKCMASRNPVALEPGRYTVILEPQAVADLMEPFVQKEFDRSWDESSRPCCRPLQLAVGQSKLGLKVMDERLTLSHDLMDPDLGVVPEPGLGSVTWVDKGVLTNLAYDRGYARWSLREAVPVQPPSLAYRLSGSGKAVSVDEMIATTQRGVLVTRFWGVHGDTGVTRDGLWLIENGKVTKPVKNFRFVQSALVALNQVEQIGAPVPVFRPVREVKKSGAFFRNWDEYGHVNPPVLLSPAVVPALKVRDFSFTAMADAV